MGETVFIIRWWIGGKWIAATIRGDRLDAERKYRRILDNGGTSIEVMEVDRNGIEHEIQL